MKELVQQVAEVQKSVKLAQMRLLRGRQQTGTAGGRGARDHGAVPGSAPPGSGPRPGSRPKRAELLWLLSARCPGGEAGVGQAPLRPLGTPLALKFRR